MSNSPKTPRANPILIGKAEEIDLLLPAVRQMMERQGIYLASDTERPGWTVPLAVNAEGLWSMQLDSRLNPERFKDTVQIAGPFYAPGEEVESAAQSTHTAALGIDLAALRARVVSAIERITSGTGQMRVPADLTDPDLVLADVLTLLDALDPHCTDSPKGGSEARVSPWRPIVELPISDDLFWFARGDTVDGPRAPQAGGYDADEWDWFAPAEAPAFTPKMEAECEQHRAELNKAQAGDAEVEHG